MRIPCRDPATGASLGEVAADSPEAVAAKVSLASAAAAAWAGSSFEARRGLVRVLRRLVVEQSRSICAVAARDSGKPVVDAAFGEMLTTLEKCVWLEGEGERWLRPERRSAGRMMSYKKAQVVYEPLGVVGAIVPWNYPIHNVLNPVLAAVFAGNAAVVKVSEHAAWSGAQLSRVLRAALRAAGAPEDLVQIVQGYGEAGAALAGSPGVAKLIFVGSQGVGRAVLREAVEPLTPVVLELGGKDAFVVLDDVASLDDAVATGLRGGFQSAGQNCAGAERFIVHRSVYERFCDKLAAVASAARIAEPYLAKGVARNQPIEKPIDGSAAEQNASAVQSASGASGAASNALSVPNPCVDVGAMCMPGAPLRVHSLVRDAVERGARCLAGGYLPPSSSASGPSFYPPTVLVDVPRSARIWTEEVFGPVLMVIPFASDDEAVEVANDCPFGLGANVFSADVDRARRLGLRIKAGMLTINDFATTYMCQSLPFGGVKESGFDRFAGVEGLRGLTNPRAVVQDRWPFKTTIPPLLRYPVDPRAPAFVDALARMFYGTSLATMAGGLADLAKVFLLGKGSEEGKKRA